MAIFVYKCDACGTPSEQIRPRVARDKKSECKCGGALKRVRGSRAETAMFAPVIELTPGSQMHLNNVAIINAPVGARFNDSDIIMENVYFGTTDAMEVYGGARLDATGIVHRPGDSNVPPDEPNES